MPVPARHILATTKLLIQQHGDGAPYVAAVMLDELQSKGDLDGAEEWQQVVNAIKRLLPPPGSDDEVNQ